MKKILLSSVALFGLTAGAMAADLPSRRAPAPVVAAVPVFTWTGFYVGGQVGYQWGDNNRSAVYGYDYDGDGIVSDADVLFASTFGRDDGDGFVAGAHVGYNFQFGSFVVGAEADIEGVFGDDDNNHYYAAALPAYGYGRGDLDWQGSIRARAGFAFDRVLVYATGGFAFGGYSGGHGGYYNGYYYGGDDTATGWTVGAGVEYAFTNNLTARVEYRYTSLDRGGDNYLFATPAFYGVGHNNDDDFHAVRVGVSYKF